MPLVFLFLGVLFIVVAINGTQGQLIKNVQQDFTGNNNFLIWVAAIAAIGALGYVQELKPLSVAFLALIIVVILLRNGGFITQFSQAFSSTSTAPAASS